MVLRDNIFGAEVMSAPDDDYLPTLRNPKTDLKQLRDNAKGGGFKLAERLLTPWLHNHIRIYWYGTRSSWSWYDEQVDTSKKTTDAIRFYVKMANGGWQREIGGVIVVLFETPAHLVDTSIDWTAPNADLEHQQGPESST